MTAAARRTWRLVALVAIAIAILGVREACADVGQAEPETTSLVLIGSIMGGVFAVVNGAFRLVEKAIANRAPKTNGNGACRFDHNRLEKQISETSSGLAQLLRHVDGFSRSHEILGRSCAELVQAQTRLDHRFEIFLVKFEDYIHTNGGVE